MYKSQASVLKSEMKIRKNARMFSEETRRLEGMKLL
jgi:hypothetical protein